jgi:hypothetical protein
MVDQDPDVNEFGRVYRNERGQIGLVGERHPQRRLLRATTRGLSGPRRVLPAGPQRARRGVSYTRWWPPADADDLLEARLNAYRDQLFRESE